MNQIKEMLELNQLIDRLKEYCVTEKAGELFENLTPIMIEQELRQKLKETSEARKLLDVYGAPPLSTVYKIKELVEMAVRGELLSISELESIQQFATLSSRLIRYLKKSEELNIQISGYGKGMVNLDFLRDEIERCIRGGRIDDYASKELKEIRRKIECNNSNIRLKLETILRNKKEYFSESFISNRNGHNTLPVKKEYKLQVSGSVIDISSSGATYFIEPSSIVKLKEELNELQIAENNEERRILYLLSSNVSDVKADILLNLEYIEEIDFIFAKAKLSAQMQGKEPKINTNRYIEIVNGRHPLIPKQVCIPLNIQLGGLTRGIVITGPNTGGKTVALKTVGLYSVMAQCGLHIPCEEANICMNTQVLCDIGDGQSITENLSTFSAHIRNVIEIVKKVEEDSLVLMDELGSGTDPSEGMGIAIAILEELQKSHCNFIATTHYPEVKEYAQQAKGIINARMAFDKESLKPLYSLELGEAGESCAFYIAKQLGMSDAMLERAYKATYEKAKNPFLTEWNSIYKTNPYKIEENRKKQNWSNKSAVSIKKMEDKKQINQRSNTFQIGDSVIVYPQEKVGIVFQTANEKGEIGVQIQKIKIMVNHKRIQLKALAKDLYPEDYDFSILFDSVENRKARHTMERKYVKGLEIKQDEIKTR